MSEIKVNSIKGVGATAAAITVNNSDGTCTANITNNLSNKNKVINGAMLVNQRGNQSSVTTSVYGLDRFKVQEAADVTYDINQSTESPNGFANSFHIDIQGAQASPSASHFMQLMTALEGFDVQDFAKGTSEAKQYTVSFYVKTNVTGNYALQITDDNSRSCSQLYTVSDTNWNRYTVTFPADTTGAIDNDNTEGLRLTWHLLVGTDRSSGTMNTTWAATTTANIAAGQNANVASSTSNNWYITGVQLEVGSVATDFEHRSFAQELSLCQRYFYMHASGAEASANNRAPIATGAMFNSPNWNGVVNFPVNMRTSPSLYKVQGTGYFIIYGDGGSDEANSASLDSASPQAGTVNLSGGLAQTSGTSHWGLTNNSAARLGFDAEL